MQIAKALIYESLKPQNKFIDKRLINGTKIDNISYSDY